MKTSNLTTRIAVAALFLGVLVYFGFYIFNSYTGGLTTVQACYDTVNTGVEALGLVVREEQVIPAPSVSYALSDPAPSEGEKVAGGDRLVTLYSSVSALEARQSIRTLEAEIEQLEYALRASAGASDSSRVESDLLSTIASLHAGVSAGDLSGLETGALELRTLVFKRDYTYGDDAAQELQALIADKSARLDALRVSLGAASTVIYAPGSGVFSGVVDGFESLLRPDMLDRITPSELIDLQRQDPAAPAAIGKLITSSTWYLAAAVPAEQAAGLRTGHSYTVVFSGDYSGEIPMTLERVSDEEEGRAALVFSCRTHLSEVTLLRSRSVEIITQQLTGIRIPRSALRALTRTVQRTVEDPQTGQTSAVEEEVTVTGVYTVVSQQAEFTPVNVIYQGEDFFLVEPSDPDSARRLRAGDEIIIYTAGIFDGKVVR